jgi:hypothetical protein
LGCRGWLKCFYGILVLRAAHPKDNLNFNFSGLVKLFFQMGMDIRNIFRIQLSNQRFAPPPPSGADFRYRFVTSDQP